MKEIQEYLIKLYPDNYLAITQQIKDLISSKAPDSWLDSLDQKNVMLITYGDSIQKTNEIPLKTLKHFLDTHTDKLIKNVHILPMFPYSSDDGFSVIDYTAINPILGDWADIESLAKDYELMFDAVINHISAQSEWFKGFLKGDPKYNHFFITCDANLDYSEVVRPRALPLYYTFETSRGAVDVWATFSNDQIDLNYQNPEVLLEVLKILIFYIQKGARFIRLDAVGFLWKKVGTPSIHLKETHLIVQLIRRVIDSIDPGVKLITETNVPHQENISYFGDTASEAHMVYQFPLPPLTLFSFITEAATHLMNWATTLADTPLKKNTTYFNFLASHDGIGMRPVEAILNPAEKEMMVNHVINNGGKVSYKINKDGTHSPYELNINYMDALSHPTDSQSIKVKKMLAAHAILLSMQGLPAIYIHSLLGSTSDIKGLNTSGINRRINREKLQYDAISDVLSDESSRQSQVFEGLKWMIKIRGNQSAFHPHAGQTIVPLDSKVFSVIRFNQTETILCVINVSSQPVSLETAYIGFDLIEEKPITKTIAMNPYQVRWIVLDSPGSN